MKPNNLLKFTKQMALNSGEILMSHFGQLTNIQRKSEQIDLVTEADLQSEKLIVEKITKHFPDHAIVAEESDLVESQSDYRWVIDPLDGTTNYVHNFPVFAVSIGLQFQKETIVGVVYNPATNEMYHAQKGAGSFLNDKPIKVSDTKKLIDSILVTGFSYKHDKIWHKSFDLFHDLHERVQGMRRLGAAALDFCFVAKGIMDGFYESRLHPWDICAGDLILREAGGVTSHWNGNQIPFSGSLILATNGRIHEEVLSVLQKEEYRIFLDELK